jgi:tetratricopeptide (TPR) repeat protein
MFSPIQKKYLLAVNIATAIILIASLANLKLFPLKGIWVTTQNLPGVVFFAGRHVIYRTTWATISVIPVDPVRINLQAAYLHAIPGHQFWHPLDTFRNIASESLARHYIDKQDWHKLADLGSYAADIDPRQAEYRYWQGLASERKNLNRAIEFYYQALAIQSDHLLTLNRLTTILMQSGRLPAAERILTPFMEIKERYRYPADQTTVLDTYWQQLHANR